MTDYVGALDQGTSSTRFAVFDRAGRPIAIVQREHQVYPRPGWVEHDPVEILERSDEVIRAALGRAGITAADLVAVGITNQRETTVVWDRQTGRPIHNAIVWQDTRTTWDICEFLLDLHERGQLDTHFGTLDRTLPYHAPCQLRSHGIGLPALDLFELVPGLRAIDMDHDCCGIAGTYGLKSERYDIAMAVGEPLFERVRQSAASQAACDSETCRRQIEKATRTSLRHPVEILAEAYAAGDREANRSDPQGAASRLTDQ